MKLDEYMLKMRNDARALMPMSLIDLSRGGSKSMVILSGVSVASDTVVQETAKRRELEDGIFSMN